ncbi:MAG: OB-fold domain-containing protein [Actinomycetota bacterium]
MNGLVSYGTYVPYWRLDRSSITGVLGSGGGRGTRSVAGYDEDTTSMGVEAARRSLAALPEDAARPGLLVFSTTAPGYLDKTNATAVHAALRLDDAVPAFDAIGAARSSIGAAWTAQAAGGMAVLADVRTGRPGSADEGSGGDAAVALDFGGSWDDRSPIAVPLASASVSAEFIDRWRVPGESYSRQWEERFGEHAYVPAAKQAIERTFSSVDIEPGEVEHVVVTGLHARSVRAVAGSLGIAPERFVDDRSVVVGNTGAAHWALMLCDALDRAQPGERILVVHLADGCDSWLLETTEQLATFAERRASTVDEQIAAGVGSVDYGAFLTWRGFLEREPPRRPEPDRPASPPSLRGTSWKYGFVGAKDDGGFVHLPPGRVAVGSGAIDEMEPVPMADRTARIATFTVDRLAYSLAPPVVAAIVDFEDPDDPAGATSGRMQIELTDVDPDAVRIGDRVEMTFRRLYTVDGIHNYFWKARPAG